MNHNFNQEKAAIGMRLQEHRHFVYTLINSTGFTTVNFQIINTAFPNINSNTKT